MKDTARLLRRMTENSKEARAYIRKLQRQNVTLLETLSSALELINDIHILAPADPWARGSR